MASPDKKIERLEAELADCLDQLDELNRAEAYDGRDIAAKLCGMQARIWHIQTSLEMRKGNHGVAEKHQRKAAEWEKSRAAAEREREKQILHEVMAIYEKQQKASEAMFSLTEADLPDFDPDDEP